MNLPGFTAEGSLYKTNGRYQMVGAFTNVHPQAIQMSQQVFGSLTGCLDECQANTNSPDEYAVCSHACRCVYQTDNPVECLSEAAHELAMLPGGNR